MAYAEGQETTKSPGRRQPKEKTLPVVSRSSNCLRLSHAIVENNYWYKFLKTSSTKEERFQKQRSHENYRRDRVRFLRRFGLKTGVHFAHFGLESGMVFERSKDCMNVFIVLIPNE